jgi:hypothetical protein
MDTKDRNDTGPPVHINPPPYTQFDPKDREQFLSEIGNFTPPQREIFHTLCKTWQPEILFSRIIAQISPAIKNAAFEIERLMEKLSEKRWGLMTLRYTETETVKDKIILTSQGDCRYYFFRLANELEFFYSSLREPIPMETGLIEKGFNPPPGCTENLTVEDFSRVFDEKPPEDFTIYRIGLADGNSIFLPPGGGTRFINHCLAKLRDSLSNTNLLAELARIRATSITDLRNKAETKDPLFWLDFSKSILALKNDLLASKKVNVESGFYQAAGILHQFIQNHMQDLKRKKIEQDERDQDMEGLALQIEKEKSVLISPDRFSELLNALQEKYGDKFAAFRKEFYENFIEYKEKIKVPRVILINNSFIHRHNFYDFFIRRLDELRDMMLQEYVKIMEHLLRTNNRERKTLFFSRDNFETDFLERLRDTDPFVFEIRQKPRLLAEIIIYAFREKMKVKDLNEIKEELERYFKPDSMVYKNFTTILSLTIIDIFFRAFSRLPFWRQIWLKITGKYKSYQNQYMGQSTKLLSPASFGRKDDKRIQKTASSDQGYPPRQDGKPAAGTRIKIQRRRRIEKPKPVVKKAYSKKQQESAWQDFSKIIRPK